MAQLVVDRNMAIALRRILNRAYEDGVDRLLSVFVNSLGVISGTFQDGNKIIEFAIGDRVTTKVTQLGIITRQDSVIRRDRRSKRRKCTNGLPCKGTCISPKFKCEQELENVAKKEEIRALNNAVRAQNPPPVQKPDGDGYDSMSIRDLREVASEKEIVRYSHMTKDEMITALRVHDADPLQQERIRKSLEDEKKLRKLEKAKTTAVGSALNTLDPSLGKLWNLLTGISRRYNQKKMSREEATILGLAAILGLHAGFARKQKKAYKENIKTSAVAAGGLADSINVDDVGDHTSVTYVVGSHGMTGKKMEDTLRETGDPEQSEWLNSQTSLRSFDRANESRARPIDPLGKFRDNLTEGYRQTIGRSVGVGKNPDSIRLAAELYAQGQATHVQIRATTNPETGEEERKAYAFKPPINIIAGGDGGFVAREAIDILNQMKGGKVIAERIQIVTLGTPSFGVTSGAAKELNLMGNGDPWSQTPFQADDVKRQAVSGVQGNNPANYIDSPEAMATMINRLKGSEEGRAKPGSPNMRELKDKKAVRKTFSDEEFSGIMQQARVGLLKKAALYGFDGLTQEDLDTLDDLAVFEMLPDEEFRLALNRYRRWRSAQKNVKKGAATAERIKREQG
jgi:hypothetical protein